jgi:hypothetical protein
MFSLSNRFPVSSHLSRFPVTAVRVQGIIVHGISTDEKGISATKDEIVKDAEEKNLQKSILSNNIARKISDKFQLSLKKSSSIVDAVFDSISDVCDDDDSIPFFLTLFSHIFPFTYTTACYSRETCQS